MEVFPFVTCNLRKTMIRYLSWKNKCVSCTYIKFNKLQFRGDGMKENKKYFLVKEKALPEVLLKVVEAKRLLDAKSTITIQEATDKVGISRSSFYKYKDDIFPFHENARGKTITFMLQMDDEPGLLSTVLNIIAEHKANILTIHQSIPVNGIALLTTSVQIPPQIYDAEVMIEEIEHLNGIHSLKILARE